MPRALVELLTEQADAIADRFVALLRERRAPEQLPKSALLDHIPSFLASVARGLSAPGTEATADAAELADAHGEERWQQGFELREVVGDYSVLHEAILIEADHAGLTLTLEEARRLTQQISGGIAAAVAKFVEMQDQRARAAAEQLDQLQRVRDEFLSNLSHELRTPLHTIGLCAQVLRSGVSLAGADSSLDVIQRSVAREAELVEQLLEMAAHVTGRVRLDWGTVDLGVIVRDTLATLAPTAVAKTVRLHDDICTSRVDVHGDRERLLQVVWQLLTNAIRFTPRHGDVWISLQSAPDHDAVVLEIRDTGPGLSKDFLDAAFEPFRQGQTGSTRTYGGLGLGLSLVRHIVELHGGTIEADSDEGGATFRLSLPLSA